MMEGHTMKTYRSIPCEIIGSDDDVIENNLDMEPDPIDLQDATHGDYTPGSAT